MKSKKIIAWMLIFIMLVTICPSYSEAKVALKFQNITGTKKVMYVGSSFSLKVNVTVEKLTFTSSKNSIAVVSDKGIITANKKGTCFITVKNKLTKASKKITINVKNKLAYQINKKSGTYNSKQNVKVIVKKGYMVYYSTNGRFKAGQVIKSKKSKTFMISKTTTINLYPVKGAKKLSTAKLNKTKKSNKLCADYYYIIKPADSSTPSPTPTVVASLPPVISPVPTVPIVTLSPPDISSSPIIPTDVTQEDYTSPTRVNYTEFDTDDSEDADFEITPLPLDTNYKGEFYEISKKGKVTILKEGTYKISGEFASNINIEAPNSKIHVILDGVTAINNGEDSAFKIKKDLDSNIAVTLAAGSKNVFTDSHDAMVDSGDFDANNNPIMEEPDGAFTCKKGSVLTINGTGTLETSSILGTGIKSTGALKIMSGKFKINAGKHGVSGKEYLGIKGGEFDITSGADGIKTTKPTDSKDGYLDIVDASFRIKSGQNGITAYTTLYLSLQELNIEEKSGAVSAENGYYGINAGKTIDIQSGDYNITTVGDSLYSKGSIAIKGGTLLLTSSGNVVYAKDGLYIGRGVITLNGAVGMKGKNITISGGMITVLASDKGICCAGGRQGDENLSGQLLMSNGKVSIDSEGDGIDVNGSFFMQNGVFAVEGSDHAIYSKNIFQIAGGCLLALGNLNGILTPTVTTMRPFVQMDLPGKQAVGTIVDVKKDGVSILSSYVEATLVSKRAFQSVLFSVPNMEFNNTYTCEIGESKYDVTLIN